MDENDILHLLIKDLQGGNIYIGLNNADTGYSEDTEDIEKEVRKKISIG